MSLFSDIRRLDPTDEKGNICGNVFVNLGDAIIKIERPGGVLLVIGGCPGSG
jgi:hypothetical protein